MIHNCRVCNVELTDENWYSNYICKSCEKEYSKQYRLNHKEKIREYLKEYYLNKQEEISKREKQYYEANKEEILEKRKQYQLLHKEEKKEYDKQYREEHKEELLEKAKIYQKTPIGKIVQKKVKSKRRELGYNPLNDWFVGSHGHHINRVDVIHIPNELHKEFLGNHKQKNTVSLIPINTCAYFFLMMQNIDELSKIFNI